MKKRLLSILLCLVLIFAAVPTLAMPSIEEQARFQAPAISTLQALRESWSNTVPSGKTYPDDVAGLYVTDDYKAAVVLVRGATEARKNEIRALVQTPELLVFKNAKYSYNELEAIKDKIDTDGTFELVSRSVGELETENAVIVEVYYGGKAAAKAYFKKYGDKVKVTEGEMFTLYIDPETAILNEAWLRENFPKLRSMETTETRFVFASAPIAIKTRAVLNKKGESLTLYRFETEKDLQKANAMIKGSTLVFAGKTVYVDSKFPVTYYFNTKENTIALYCGADYGVHTTLIKTFQTAGTFGGYFDARHGITAPDGMDIAAPQMGYPENLKQIRKDTDSVYIATVTRVPSWNGHSINGSYALDVKKMVRGIERTSLKLSDLWPGVMIEGRTYVVCVKHVATENGATKLQLADRLYKSAFEIDDKGYILPIRNYGMKAPVKLDTFLKSI